MRCLALGYGYCTRAFLRDHGSMFESVAATARAAPPPDDARCRMVAVADKDALHRAMDAADVWLLSAPPTADDGDPFLPAARGIDLAGKQLVYLSTVGVYGDHGGAWVDETAAPAPGSERSRRRLAAENGWRRLASEGQAHLAILRLPGIYGPGRSAIDTLRAGTARRIVKAGQVFSRIHVDDIAGFLALLLADPHSAIVNLADDAPSPPQDVIAFAASLLGLPPPPEEPYDEAAMTPMLRSFFAENKRISNRKMTSAYGYQLRYPSYREGLTAIAQSGL